ncbi:MAG: proteophosphoglycan precursor [Alphaproteobacteria bacterium]|nr:MAG: proteophosphoglycan precursor [Alphaproteobacteria bacterium]
MDSNFFRKNAPEEQFDIRIDRNGQWYHRESPIGRDKIAKLFSTVLHYDTKSNDYWLITPVEQGRINVEDVPYIITDFEIHNGTFTLSTNLGHIATANADNIILCRPDNGLPYIHVHNNVMARLNRSAREKLINMALEQNGYDELSGELTLTIDGIKHGIAVNKP